MPKGITFLHAFGLSAFVRATALHRAIRSAIQDDNPHAAFPLLRSYVETAIAICYLVDRPEKVGAFLGQTASDRPKLRRPSSQALINHATSRYPGVKALWTELCDLTHMGSPAVWMPFVVEDEDLRLTTISSVVRWRRPEEGSHRLRRSG